MVDDVVVARPQHRLVRPMADLVVPDHIPHSVVFHIDGVAADRVETVVLHAAMGGASDVQSFPAVRPSLPRLRGHGSVALIAFTVHIVAGGRLGRFLFLLDGDLLYSTYNNRFPIREGKGGALEVGIGFNGGGAPWKPLKDMVKLIPGTTPPGKK